MSTRYQRALEHLRGNVGFTRLNHGLEKEALRIDRHGYLSKKPHPSALGAALTHTAITTDFSEAQLEFITSVHTSIDQCVKEMERIHALVYQALDNEILWPSSMPCMLKGERTVPIAEYGRSNLGRMKHIYRQGLGHRYGRYMQTISGVHFNFSIPAELWNSYAEFVGARDTVEFRNDSYLSMIREFQSTAWLVLYLFGSSPAVCGSFMAGRLHELENFGDESYHLPYATSLRMGPLGYKSAVQAKRFVSYNSIESYTQSILPLLMNPHPPYTEIGIKDDRGEYKQLSTAMLQIEAEFYATVRPKPQAKGIDRPLVALNKEGIEYVELRCLDLNPYFITGIDRVTLHFLDALLLYLWLSPSKPDSQDRWDEIQHNDQIVAEQGRKPDLKIRVDGKEESMQQLALEILEQVKVVAEILDEANDSKSYRASVDLQRQKVVDVSHTPSAILLQEMADTEQSYYWTVASLAKKHQESFKNVTIPTEMWERFDQLNQESRQEQARIEAADELSLDDYIIQSQSLEGVR